MDERVAVEEQRAVEIAGDPKSQNLWDQYASTRPYLASTPYAEVASILCRNRHAIIGDTLKRASTAPWNDRGLPQTESDIDSTLLAMAGLLLAKGGSDSSPSKDIVGDDMIDSVLAKFINFIWIPIVQIVEENGQRYLELDSSFATESGPDVFVLLHSEAVPSSYSPESYVNLGRIQSFTGAQRYAIPADVDLSVFQSAVIWCEDFNVTFGYAIL